MSITPLIVALVLAAEPTAPTDVPQAQPLPVEVVGVQKGDPAPMSGVVLTEARFKIYLDQQKRADMAEAKNAELQEQLRQCLVKCEGCKPPEGSSFHKPSFTAGMVVGGVVTVAVTAAIGYGVYELFTLAQQQKK